MIFLVSALLVLSVFNSLVLFGTLASQGLTRREVNEAIDAQVAASNIIADRMSELNETVEGAIDCLVSIDAARALREQEE